MEAVESILFNLLFLLSISVELRGIHVSEKDLRYSSLRDQHVIVLDNSERYRRHAPIVSNPLPSQNISQIEGTTLMAANTTSNEVNKTTSVPLPTTTTPPSGVTNDNYYSYYYSLTMQNQADNYWVELSNATLHQGMRNTSSRKVQTIQFQNSSFLFYGHQIYNVTIATGGFLFMSPFVHSFLTTTQYTAPLMANFGTMGNNSNIYFQEYANQFIVEWRNVYLLDQENFGPFKFQTILYKNGSIAFIYQKVPVAISNISTLNHPVRIGMSDAFYIDTKIGQIKRRTIHEYHRISVDFTTVKPKTVIILHPLPSCNMAKDCYTCVTQKIGFTCKWCAKVQRCSDSVDWFRQEWLDSGCLEEGHNSADLCDGTTSKLTPNVTTTNRPSTTETNNKILSIKTQSTPMPSPTIIFVPTSSTTGLATNQTINRTSPSPSPRQITTTKATPKTTILRDLLTNITTPVTTTLKTETSQMLITKSTMNSTEITTSLNSNTTTYQTTEKASPNPASHKSTTIQTTQPITTLKKLTTNTTTHQSTTLRKDTSQMLTTNTTTTTTTVAPCNKTKDRTCGQGTQSISQNQVSLASGSSNASMIAMIVVLGLIVLGILIAFLVYAYRNLTSTSGQWLIQNRQCALRERIKNIPDNFFKGFSDFSEKI